MAEEAEVVGVEAEPLGEVVVGSGRVRKKRKPQVRPMCRVCEAADGTRKGRLCVTCYVKAQTTDKVNQEEWVAAQRRAGVPAKLADLRWVKEFTGMVASAGRVVWQELREKSPRDFVAKWEEEEGRYAEELARVAAAESDAVPKPERDDKLDACVGLARDWLRQRAAERGEGGGS